MREVEWVRRVDRALLKWTIYSIINKLLVLAQSLYHAGIGITKAKLLFHNMNKIILSVLYIPQLFISLTSTTFRKHIKAAMQLPLLNGTYVNATEALMGWCGRWGISGVNVGLEYKHKGSENEIIHKKISKALHKAGKWLDGSFYAALNCWLKKMHII